MSRAACVVALLCLLALSTAPLPALSLRLHGTVSSHSTFHYLAQFVFESTGGNFSSHSASTLPASTPSNQHILLYPDTLWPKVIFSTNCSEQAHLGVGGAVGTALEVEVNGHRPHWWYVALVDCEHGGVSGMEMEYSFHLTNGGGQWQKEVSYNQQHMAETSLAYFLVFLLLVPLLVVSAVKARSTYTQVPHILLTAIAASLSLAYLLYASEYLTLIRTGSQYVGLSSAAYFFQQFAATLLVFNILITCAGYPLTRPLIAHLAPIAAATFLVFGLYVASYVVAEYTQAAWSTKYVFDNPAGYALSIVYGLLPLACFALIRSTRRLPNPSATHNAYFYASYLAFASLYLLSVPFITLGTSLANSWWVAKAELAATGCVLCLTVFGQWLFFQPFTLQTRERRFKTLDEPSVAGSKRFEQSTFAMQAEAGEGEASSGDVELSEQGSSGGVVPI